MEHFRLVSSIKQAFLITLACCVSMAATHGRQKYLTKSSDSLDVHTYVERYISVNKKDLLRTTHNNKRLVDFIENLLQKNGLPVQLKNLAIIESGLNSQTLSSAGAAGCWQLMPEEARTHGLIIDNIKDERVDILKSTLVAIRLLKELYAKYNDWLLVIAAYNCGSGRIDKSIKQMHEMDFWKIQQLLPQETRNHVKKFVAVSIALDGSMSFYEKKMSKEHGSAALDTIFVSAAFQLKVIARFLQIQEEKLRDLNRDFEDVRRNKSECLLLLPAGLVPDFMLYRSEILRASIAESN